MVLKDKVAVIGRLQDNHNTTFFYYGDPGDSPNNIKFNLKSTIPATFPGALTGYYETASNIIISIKNSREHGYFTYDKNKDELRELKLSFPEPMIFNNDGYFKGRVWDIYVEEGAKGAKVLWINPETLESGGFDLDLNKVDIDKVEPFYSSGKVVIYGVRRSDSAAVLAVVDFETESTRIDYSLLEKEVITLIPLN